MGARFQTSLTLVVYGHNLNWPYPRSPIGFIAIRDGTKYAVFERILHAFGGGRNQAPVPLVNADESFSEMPTTDIIKSLKLNPLSNSILIAITPAADSSMFALVVARDSSRV
jgi:hypothetical protein